MIVALGCSATTGDGVEGEDSGRREVGALPDAVAMDAPPTGEDTGARAEVGPGVDAPSLDVTREDYCRGAGPPVMVGDTTRPGARCAGRLAESLFRYAICTCTDLALAGYLHTDSFDSALGEPGGERGGAVGINGAFALVGATRIGDAFTLAGSTPLRLVGSHVVRGALDLGAPLEVIGALDVERGARVRGNITALGPVHIQGDLTTPAGSVSLGVLRVDGARRNAPVDVAPPCACRPDELLDVAGFAREAATRNDNASVGFRQDVFHTVIGEARVELPCGRYYVDRIAGLGSIQLTVNGRTALFVGGDFDLGGFFNVRLGASGELDVFVGGSILGAGYLRMGRVERPSRVRFYIGGDRGFTLLGAAGFQGNVYAPRAPVTIAGFNELRGALFAGRIITGGDLDVHYDRSILRAGETCPDDPRPGVCTGCGSGVCRSTQACVAGVCGACRNDGDCCPPLVCDLRVGQCLPLPP